VAPKQPVMRAGHLRSSSGPSPRVVCAPASYLPTLHNLRSISAGSAFSARTNFSMLSMEILTSARSTEAAEVYDREFMKVFYPWCGTNLDVHFGHTSCDEGVLYGPPCALTKFMTAR
jgi:hypothetical protein